MAARAIFYDTETTGISAKKDFIIEIAAYDPERDKTLELLVNPGVPIPPDATRIHGITDAMVAEAPTFEEVGKTFSEFCEGDVILIAHNNDAFDVHFLREEFARNGIPLPDWRYFDTLKWARRYRTDLPRHALQFLREAYGFEANTAHRALDDVIILYKIYAAMIDDLTIEEAHALLNKPRAIQHMPFGKHQGEPLAKVPKSYVSWLAKSGAFDKAENQELKKSFESLQLL